MTSITSLLPRIKTVRYKTHTHKFGTIAPQLTSKEYYRCHLPKIKALGKRKSAYHKTRFPHFKCQFKWIHLLQTSYRNKQHFSMTYSNWAVIPLSMASGVRPIVLNCISFGACCDFEHGHDFCPCQHALKYKRHPHYLKH